MCLTNLPLPGPHGYFVNMIKSVDILNTSPRESMSLEECDQRCLQNADCVMFNYFTKGSSCSFTENDASKHLSPANAFERHIVRCKPAQRELASFRTSNYFHH